MINRIKYIVNTKVKYMPELSYNFLFTFRKIIIGRNYNV